MTENEISCKIRGAIFNLLVVSISNVLMVALNSLHFRKLQVNTIKIN
jgi:hypothetical protein